MSTPKRQHSDGTEADAVLGQRPVKRRTSGSTVLTLGSRRSSTANIEGDHDEPHVALSAVVQAVIEAQRAMSGGPEASPPQEPQSQHQYNSRPPMLELQDPGDDPTNPGYPSEAMLSPRRVDSIASNINAARAGSAVLSVAGSSTMRLADVTGLPYGCVMHFTNCAAHIDCLRPWKVHSPEVSTGTGFHIGGKRLITNNHVIEAGTSIRVSRHGKPGNFEAKVLVASGMCDLSLVTVEDDEFWEGVPEVVFQEKVPDLDDTVVAVGYPLGATTVTLTRGVVSNVHLKDLSLSEMSPRQLCVQIDAAINPGNSGGPVFNQESHEVVGVAFAGQSDAQGTGFIIPTPVIKSFIAVYDRTGSFDRLPSLGVTTQDLVNKSMRRYAFGEPTAHHDGVLIQKVQPFSCAKAAGLKDGDILMKIDGQTVSEEGEVVFRGHERVGWEYLVTKHPIGAEIALTLLRKHDEGGVANVPVNATVKLATNFTLVPRELGKGFTAEYVIAGGLVLLSASVPLLMDCVAERRTRIHSAIYDANQKSHLCEDQDAEAVLVCDCLAHEINVKYDTLAGNRLKTINGVTVRNLKHVADLVSGCTEPFMVFRFFDIVGTAAFDTALVKSGLPTILRQHKLPAWTSFPGY